MKVVIRDNNLVIFVENKLLYRKKGFVLEDDYVIEIGKVDIKREGIDVIVIIYGRML